MIRIHQIMRNHPIAVMHCIFAIKRIPDIFPVSCLTRWYENKCNNIPPAVLFLQQRQSIDKGINAFVVKFITPALEQQE
jgi:hypothetical protein